MRRICETKSEPEAVCEGHSSRSGRRSLQLLANAPLLLRIVHLALACSWFRPALATRVPFENCLDDSYIWTNSEVPEDQVQLQFYPLVVDAVFDPENGTHNLLITVWGNVTGRVGDKALPSWDSPEWDSADGALDGKIVATPFPGDVNRNTTLYNKVDVLTDHPYVDNLNFCDQILNTTCPLGPLFNRTPINLPDEPYSLPSFRLSHDFESTYSFASFAPTLTIIWGDADKTSIGCVSATVTPTLGDAAWSLKFGPLFVLIVVGLATAFAAVFSPWGTSDVFHWTSNYGRDPDLLRLVTPGFGDCLQYIQFILLTGALSLEYPGFYQPVVSQVSWSTLMFNESFVSKSEPFQSIRDGVYYTEGDYGLQHIAQLDGIGEVQDIWAGMIIWLLVIIGAVLLLIQIGFLARWLYRIITNTPEEDLRAKNFPFSAGNVIRLVFSYFLLPVVALSAFQLVVSGQSKAVLIFFAVLTLILVVGFGVRLMYLIATTKPRAHLFDDLSTVLLYGPLYNTYSDQAAVFAVIPIFLTFLRGVAIGAVQASGTAQIVILAVCEVVQILTLYSFRPFHPDTSMNLYHMGFSALRCISILLMVAFTPSLGITEGPKGWIGYAIFLIHGFVLVFGFFLNALQTIIEVIARLCGAGSDDVRGQTRGGLTKIFGARQLSRRVDRRGGPSRQSQLSTTAMLGTENGSKRGAYGRVRSDSAGSMGVLMNQQRSSSALDALSIDAYSIPMGAGSTFTPTTPGEASTFSFLPAAGQATRPQPAADPYYRAPRARRETVDGAESESPNRARRSIASVDLTSRRISQPGGAGDTDTAPAPAPAPALYQPVFAPRADYSTREVDFYYGVRGPALNSDSPGRRLGTGPADPTSPVATATGWIRGLFGGKTKEKGKGFEVVRSSRMPPAMQARGGDFGDDAPPEGIPVALGVLRNGPIDSDDDDDMPDMNKRKRIADREGAEGKLIDDANEPLSDDDISPEQSGVVSKEPPLLPDFDAGSSFRVPSRLPSKASRHPSQRTTRPLPDEDVPEVPEVPRKSSKRHSGAPQNFLPPTSRPASQSISDKAVDQSQARLNATARLPFDRSNSQRRLSATSTAPTEDFSQMPISLGESGDERPASFGYVHQRSISRVDPDRRVDLLGSSAEMVNRSPGSSVSGRS